VNRCHSSGEFGVLNWRWRLGFVKVPSHNLAIAQEKKDDILVKSLDLLDELVLSEYSLWDILLLNLLVIFTDNKTAKSIFGTREYNLHSSLLDKTNVENGTIVRVFLQDDVILDHLNL
jgi:hypothetical protein